MGQSRLGQYSQWLHFQEVDRSLRAALERLESEFAQLQEQISLLGQSVPQADNVILRALSVALSEHKPSAHASSERVSESSISPAKNEFTERISSPLFDWSGLPDFGPQEMEAPSLVQEQSLSPLHDAAMELLPEDMTTFFDEHGQTEPQIELPWWLRNIAMAAGVNSVQRNGPIDQESIRTNRLVQRWVERWGRRTLPVPSEEDTPNG